ncbi:MAG: bifunctional GTP diphosphokinase/guanosine-3',5'-bis pyrophosphate 3'-pyrophosphohydrolase [Gammaproteobacteria bacterium]|nr:bifunctional GTP diphosphokinase/guanosine-3',5'-bis pyrophosphate 3'-pyrophosphohydrolase [Gammaproteobacteria bacterium]
MQTIDDLTGRLSTYLEKDHTLQITEAYYFAERHHEGQFRRSGEPYITHPLAVAYILSDMHMDHQSLMAALLHDVIEDTDATKEEVADRFGSVVAELVDGVSKISQMKFESRAIAQAENFRKMVLAMTQDIRVILVKLSDRLHNMRTLDVLQPKKRRRIATETLEIYAPIANRLGMNSFRIEFEDLGFAALYPLRAQLIEKAVRKAVGNRKEVMTQLTASIEKRVLEEQLKARVLGRQKHLYSIYNKMRDSRKPFEEIMDVFGFRIITTNVDACYRALGIMHNLYLPIPGRFKDYIAIPKANGYQSLHTTVKGLNGVPIEVQIRTEEMESISNNGIAAHWLYKNDEEQSPHHAHSRAREWMKSLLEIQQKAGSSLEFIENVKIDLFPDEVYIFTPKGNILELPAGATPIDFAYAVHTDVGNSCVAARVDNRLAPLSAPLQSGQTVKIITTNGAQPNPSWLSFVITSKARSNIRHYLKHKRQSESIILGERLLNAALFQLDSSLDALSEERIDTALQEYGFKTREDLLEDIGLGNRMAQIIARQLLSEAEESAKGETQGKLPPLSIKGTEGMVITFGKCCYPIPGDAIVGYLSSGRGIIVHTDHCKNMRGYEQKAEKYIPVVWADEVEGEYPTEIRIELESQRGALAVIANAITRSNANVESINMEEQSANFSSIRLIISVQDRVHLARAIKRLRAIKTVSKITRVKS